MKSPFSRCCAASIAIGLSSPASSQEINQMTVAMGLISYAIERCGLSTTSSFRHNMELAKSINGEDFALGAIMAKGVEADEGNAAFCAEARIIMKQIGG